MTLRAKDEVFGKYPGLHRIALQSTDGIQIGYSYALRKGPWIGFQFSVTLMTRCKSTGRLINEGDCEGRWVRGGGAC